MTSDETAHPPSHLGHPLPPQRRRNPRHSRGSGNPPLVDPRLRLVFTHILGWTQGAEVRNLALSLGERVASVASQVRGYLVMSAHPIPPRRAGDPSPGPRRLVKAPSRSTLSPRERVDPICDALRF